MDEYICGVFGDVVIRDCYRIRRWADDPPSAIFDVGANVGAFSAMCGILYPNTPIIAIEPYAENYAHLKWLASLFPNVTAICAAIGRPPFMFVDGGNRAAHRYDSGGDIGELADVAAADLGQIVKEHAGPDYFLKIDCEGAEWPAIHDWPWVFSGARYLAMELHRTPWIPDYNEGWVEEIRKTHDIETDSTFKSSLQGGLLWATRRRLPA